MSVTRDQVQYFASGARLLTRAAFVVALAVAAGCGTAVAAQAATTRPAATVTSARAVSLTTRLAPGQHVTRTVRLGSADCAALRRSLAASHPGSAPMAHCVIGLGLSAAPRALTRYCRKTGYWTSCYDKGTICFGDKPMWGGPNGSFSCDGEAYVSVDGRWKYRTPHNHKVWLLGEVRCPYAYFEGNVTETFCGKRNNGHPILTMECNFNWSGTIGPVTGGGNGYIALYAHYNGKITLYGAFHTQ